MSFLRYYFFIWFIFPAWSAENEVLEAIRANWHASITARSKVRLTLEVEGIHEGCQAGVIQTRQSFQDRLSVQLKGKGAVDVRPPFWAPEKRIEFRPTVWDAFVDDFSDMGSGADPIFGASFVWERASEKEIDGQVVWELRARSVPEINRSWELILIADRTSHQPIRFVARLREPFIAFGVRLLQFEVQIDVTEHEKVWVIHRYEEKYRYREAPNPLKKGFHLAYTCKIL